MTWLAALTLAFLWWLILRTPSAGLPTFVTRVTAYVASDPQERAQDVMGAWERRAVAAGARRDRRALRAAQMAGERVRAGWIEHQQRRARMCRVAPTAWPRIAAGLAQALDLAEPFLARRVTPIRARKRA